MMGFKGVAASNSSSSQTSDDDECCSKEFYTSSGVLTPQSQAISEIMVTRLTMKDINNEIEAYKKTAKNSKKFFSLFDTKQIVTKQEISSKLKSKLLLRRSAQPCQDVLNLSREVSK
jgi:hypothetical protein